LRRLGPVADAEIGVAAAFVMPDVAEAIGAHPSRLRVPVDGVGSGEPTHPTPPGPGSTHPKLGKPGR
jgi:hypothetical protein